MSELTRAHLLIVTWEKMLGHNVFSLYEANFIRTKLWALYPGLGVQGAFEEVLDCIR